DLATCIRGIAQMMRVGMYKLASCAREDDGEPATTDATDVAKAITREAAGHGERTPGDLGQLGAQGGRRRGALRSAGPGAVMGHPPLGDAEAIAAPLAVRRVPEQLALLHKMVLDRVRSDRLCRRLMTVLRVGPVVADLPGYGRSAAVFCPLQDGRGAFRPGTA